MQMSTTTQETMATTTAALLLLLIACATAAPMMDLDCRTSAGMPIFPSRPMPCGESYPRIDYNPMAYPGMGISTYHQQQQQQQPTMFTLPTATTTTGFGSMPSTPTYTLGQPQISWGQPTLTFGQPSIAGFGQSSTTSFGQPSTASFGQSFTGFPSSSFGQMSHGQSAGFGFGGSQSGMAPIQLQGSSGMSGMPIFPSPHA